MRRGRRRLLRTVVGATLLGVGCSMFGGPRIPPHPALDRLWRQYSALRDERALAIAGDPDGLWVGAAAGGAVSLSDAEDVALAECRRKRAMRRMQSPCLLYAVGDDIVWPRR
jgi:hypothetical protein